ncbi:MAG: hypothetical protein U0271_20550 [Polyangiaceae bacterium]
MRGPPPGWPVSPREVRRGSARAANVRAFPPPEVALIADVPLSPPLGSAPAQTPLLDSQRAAIGFGDAPFEVGDDFDDMPTFNGIIEAAPIAPAQTANGTQMLPMVSAPPVRPLAPTPAPANAPSPPANAPNPPSPTLSMDPAPTKAQPLGPSLTAGPTLTASPAPAPIPVASTSSITPRVKILLAVLLVSVVGMGAATFWVMRSPSSDDSTAGSASSKKSKKKAGSATTNHATTHPLMPKLHTAAPSEPAEDGDGEEPAAAPTATVPRHTTAPRTPSSPGKRPPVNNMAGRRMPMPAPQT